MRNKRWLSLVALLSITVIVLFNWQSISFAIALLFVDHRPSLLADARWSNPASAHAFNSRFKRGTSSVELIAWLRANEFRVDVDKGFAERTVKSLPCNEGLAVSWQADQAHRLISASATVTEQGCL
jgi:hypothetical protein